MMDEQKETLRKAIFDAQGSALRIRALTWAADILLIGEHGDMRITKQEGEDRSHHLLEIALEEADRLYGLLDDANVAAVRAFPDRCEHPPRAARNLQPQG